MRVLGGGKDKGVINFGSRRRLGAQLEQEIQIRGVVPHVCNEGPSFCAIF